jgi:Tfp pilus assembly protein PilV
MPEKRMRAGSLRAQEGGSLLEVLIALVLVALVMVGAVASQLHAVAAERSTAQRERALVIATSVVEAMRDADSGSHALPRWHAYAAAALPGAELTIADGAPGVALAVVRWTAQRSDGRTPYSARDGCMAEPATAGLACAALPFVR